jgi:glycosyltransferase involved in cell wall biosynthesis
VRFDVAHHVTFAAYWKRTGVAALDRPLVWGPVGGGVTTPPRLVGELGVRGAADELARRIVRPVAARAPAGRAVQRRAAVTLTQNAETARALSTRHPPVVLPNALAARVPEAAVPPTRDRTVVSVARLVPWKGVRLAVQAFAAARNDDVRMVVIGRGAERAQIERLAWSLGVADRITWTGQIPREEVLRTLAGAGVLIHAALHEEAGFAVSEALSYGTPVVCIDRGGPPELLRQWPAVPSHAVPPGDPQATVRALAAALDAVLDAPSPKTAVHDPARSFDEVVLDAYDTAVRRG